MNAMFLPEMQFRAWLRVEDFFALQQSLAFDHHGRTELIEGEILNVNAQFVRHGYAKSLLHLAIDRALRAIESPLVVMVETSVAMLPFNMPEPDLVVTAAPRRNGPLAVGDVALIIEIAETTQRYDLGRKAGVYARNKVPEYWVVDLTDDVIVCHTRPDSAGYGAIERVELGSPDTAQMIAGLSVTTAELLALPEKD